MSTYQWQGEPVQVEFGYVNQKENLEKPLYWYNYDCHRNKVGREWEHKFALIPAVRVTAKDGYQFCLSNIAGLAFHKLINGGWPGYAHASLSGVFTEDNAPEWKITKFSEQDYAEDQNRRNKWFAKEYPEEWKRMEALKEAGRKHLSKYL